MIKETIIKIIKNQKVTDSEMNTLLTEYVKRKKGKDPTKEQLEEIRNLVYNRIFGLQPLIDEYVKELKLQVQTLIDLKSNTIIRIDVYE